MQRDATGCAGASARTLAPRAIALERRRVRADPTDEVTALLQQLIRNACVNDGTPGSGQEVRSATLLRSYLEGCGADMEVFEPLPGRVSLVARLEGRDPAAPALLLCGHTDVVPVDEERWHREPFGGELVDGVVWGRGATDMLNLTASMAVALRRLAAGPRLAGTLVFLAVADEESGSHHGARWLLEHEADAVRADLMVTEGGGDRLPSPAGPRVLMAAGEKGVSWRRLRIQGSPSHASRPMRTDNALAKAATIVTRLAELRPQTRILDIWKRYVEGMNFPPELAQRLLDPARVWETCETLESVALARHAHACTHMTLAPTVVHGGRKVNVVPSVVELDVDIRTLPGQTGDDVDALLVELLGDRAVDVEVIRTLDDRASASPLDTPFWDAVQRVVATLAPGAQVVPSLRPGATDARFFRQHGVPSYGVGLMSGRIPADALAEMFHGDNERIDQESLRLTTALWEGLAAEVLA